MTTKCKSLKWKTNQNKKDQTVAVFFHDLSLTFLLNFYDNAFLFILLYFRLSILKKVLIRFTLIKRICTFIFQLNSCIKVFSTWKQDKGILNSWLDVFDLTLFRPLIGHLPPFVLLIDWHCLPKPPTFDITLFNYF